MDYLEVQAEPSICNNASNGYSNGTIASSSSIASRLYQNGQRNSRRNSFSSEEPDMISFGDEEIKTGFADTANQITNMIKRCAELQDLQMATAEEKSRLRAENAVLQERVHLLDEQFQTSEQRWSEKLDEEKLRLKEMLSRYEREKQLEAESGSLRYQVLEKDLKTAQKDRERAEENLKVEKEKNQTLSNQLTERQNECERLQMEKRKIKNEFEIYKRDTADRMEDNAEIMEELTRQNEFRQSDYSHHNPQGTLTEQIILLEDEIERLRTENRDLREENRELQAQILHDSVQCGQNLLANNTPSLAAELSGMDSQGLMNALKEQEIVNQRLRNYVNGILMRIIEQHPDILEIPLKEEELSMNTTIASTSANEAEKSLATS